MLGRAICCVLLLCLARVDAQCPAGYYASGSSENVAVGKSASASSTYSNYYQASYGTDGFKYSGASYTWQSAFTDQTPWFGVDLGSSFGINSMRYYGWMGLGYEYSADFDFRVGDSSFLSNPVCASQYIDAHGVAYTDVTCIATGRYVSVHKRTNGAKMAVTELQVFATPCVACDAGKTSPAGSTQLSDCVSITPTSCPTGQYLSGTSCVACDAGTYKATTGTEACTSCPADKYEYKTGSSGCLPCPTYSVANDARTDCLCNVGYRYNGSLWAL
jgi:hypothetical protein